MEREKDEAYIQESQKRDGFKDEQYFIIPTESFKEYLKHPLVKAMYLTDIGFFPERIIITGNGRKEQKNISSYIVQKGKAISISEIKSIIFTLRKCSVYQETRSINIMPVRRIRGVSSGYTSRAKIQAIIHWKNTRLFR